MKHDNRMNAAITLVISRACAPAVAVVPIVLVVSIVETVGGTVTVPDVNAMAVGMVLVEASVVNGLAHSPG